MTGKLRTPNRNLRRTIVIHSHFEACPFLFSFGDLQDMSPVILTVQGPKAIFANHQLLLHISMRDAANMRVFYASGESLLSALCSDGRMDRYVCCFWGLFPRGLRCSTMSIASIKCIYHLYMRCQPQVWYLSSLI